MPRDIIPSGMTYADAWRTIGGLSTPSKMPWYGWSTSAWECDTGSKLREIEGSVCSSCYARKGNYIWKVVQAAHERRLEAISDPRFVEAFVLVLTTLYKRGKGRENRFRWHDSGDLQSLEHFRKIIRIAELTPFLEHFLPTKEAKIVNRYRGSIPPNLHVKLSHPMMGKKFSRRPNGFSFTTVGLDDDPDLFQCPAKRLQGNKCLDCRACWTDANINYPRH